MNFTIFALALAACLAVGAYGAFGLTSCKPVSPTTYVQGVPNLVEVAPGLWRSGQPTTRAQWETISALGVKHVIKLNFEHEGSDVGALAFGMIVHTLSIQPEGDTNVIDEIADTFVPPDAENLRKALDIIGTGDAVLVHCTHGQDRTGLVIGMWRVKALGWTRERAYAEMLANNFHPILHGLHEFWEEGAW